MIAAIGIAVVDTIMLIDGFKEHEGSFHCDRIVVEGGGMAATALCAASLLGSDTRLFTRIGDDLPGRFILEGLDHFNVDTSGVVTIPGENTVMSTVLVDAGTGEKQFYSLREKTVFRDLIEPDCSLLDDAQLILVDGYWFEAALAAVRRAKERGISVVADFKSMYGRLDAIMPYIDYLIVPGFFAESVTGESVPERMLEKLAAMQPGIPVITLGVEGGVYLRDGVTRRYGAFPVETVDSTGAGDAFHGAFCHFLSRGFDLGRCIELSSAVGALNCRSIGGRSALPTLGELGDFLRLHGAGPVFP